MQFNFDIKNKILTNQSKFKNFQRKVYINNNSLNNSNIEDEIIKLEIQSNENNFDLENIKDLINKYTSAKEYYYLNGNDINFKKFEKKLNDLLSNPLLIEKIYNKYKDKKFENRKLDDKLSLNFNKNNPISNLIYKMINNDNEINNIIKNNDINQSRNLKTRIEERKSKKLKNENNIEFNKKEDNEINHINMQDSFLNLSYFNKNDKSKINDEFLKYMNNFLLDFSNQIKSFLINQIFLNKIKNINTFFKNKDKEDFKLISKYQEIIENLKAQYANDNMRNIEDGYNDCFRLTIDSIENEKKRFINEINQKYELKIKNEGSLKEIFRMISKNNYIINIDEIKKPIINKFYNIFKEICKIIDNEI